MNSLNISPKNLSRTHINTLISNRSLRKKYYKKYKKLLGGAAEGGGRS